MSSTTQQAQESGRDRGFRLRREAAMMRPKREKKPRNRKPRAKAVKPAKPTRQCQSCGKCPDLEKIPNEGKRWNRAKCGWYGDQILNLSGLRRRCPECMAERRLETGQDGGKP